ncbi:MAG: hypothetical protein WCA79_11605 [Anaerolineales bacterium]
MGKIAPVDERQQASLPPARVTAIFAICAHYRAQGVRRCALTLALHPDASVAPRLNQC